MSSLSITDFLYKASKSIPIIPPARVSGFQPGDLPGSYITYKDGYYKVDDPQYGAVGSVHLRPRSVGTNPWSIVGSGVLLENFNYYNSYKTDIAITSGAAGTYTLVGQFAGARVIRDYYGNRTFDYWQNIDIHMEFVVNGETPGSGNIWVTAPFGVFQRPSSGSIDIGDIVVSGAKAKSIQWAGKAISTRVTSTGWTLFITASSTLGTYTIVSVTATLNGVDHKVPVQNAIEIMKGSSIPDPDDPADPVDPVPVPVIVDVWGVKKSVVDTVSLGDADGIVQWTSTTHTEATGESSTEGEILPKASITDLLPTPKTFRPIEAKQIKRSVEIVDQASVDQFGRRERRVAFSGVDSWGALQQFGEGALIDAARCVEGILEIPGNPLIRAGDNVHYANSDWIVENATHTLDTWITRLTLRRIPTSQEIGGMFIRATNSVEKTIVRIVRNASDRVNNAIEGVITARIDSQRYKVRVLGQDEEIEVIADPAIFNNLLVGTSVLVGRRTK